MRDENLAEAMLDVFEGSNIDDMKELIELAAAEQRLKEAMPQQFNAVLSIITRHDPSDLITERLDYSAEVSTTLSRLHECHCIADFGRVVREEFHFWGLTGHEDRFNAIANELAEFHFIMSVQQILEHDGKLDAAELTWLAANYPAQKIAVLWTDGKLTEENARHTLKTIAMTMGCDYTPVAISLTAKAKLRLMLDATPAPKLP